MARYLFQTFYHGVELVDDIGEEFATLQHAAAHAAIVANELARNSSNDVTVCVLSPDGAVLAKAVPGDGLAPAANTNLPR